MIEKKGLHGTAFEDHRLLQAPLILKRILAVTSSIPGSLLNRAEAIFTS